MLLGKMYKYERDPTRTAGATEQTRDVGRMEGRMDRRMDGVKPIYPPTTSLWGGYNYCSSFTTAVIEINHSIPRHHEVHDNHNCIIISMKSAENKKQATHLIATILLTMLYDVFGHSRIIVVAEISLSSFNDVAWCVFICMQWNDLPHSTSCKWWEEIHYSD